MLLDPHTASTDAEFNEAFEEDEEVMEHLLPEKHAADPGLKKKNGFDPIQQYMSDIGSYRLVSREEEKALALRIQKYGDENAVNQLVVANLRLVIKIAMKFQRYWDWNLLDLIQEGNIGLMKAVRKYDPTRNVKFSHYASFWIKAYILKYIQNNWRMVKVVTTGGYRKLFYRLRQEKRKLRSMGIEPTPKLLSERCDVDEKDIVEMEQRMKKQDFSLNAPLKENSDTNWLDMIKSDDQNVEQEFTENEMQQLISDKIAEFRKTIPKREKKILDLRIYSDSPLTLQSLGDRLGLSRERIRQIEKEILGQLKTYLIHEIKDLDDYAGVCPQNTAVMAE